MPWLTDGHKFAVFLHRHNKFGNYYPTVYYTYNGRSYAFNGQVIAEYDYVFSTLTNKGIITTAIILNDIHPGYMELVPVFLNISVKFIQNLFRTKAAVGIQALNPLLIQ